jgi:N-acetylneuraminate 9-O-acetyltransferase
MSLETEYRNIHFLWDPYLNVTHPRSLPPKWTGNVIVASGLWHTRYLDDSFLDDFEKQIRRFAKDFRFLQKDFRGSNRTQPNDPFPETPIFMPLAQPLMANLSFDRSLMLTFDRVMSLNNKLYHLSQELRFHVMWSSMFMAVEHENAFEHDGLHTSNLVASKGVDVLLNFLCNGERSLRQSHYCCSEFNWAIPDNQVLSLDILFLVLLFYLQKVARRAMFPTTELPSMTAKAVTILLSAVLYSYVADRTTVFEGLNKLVDENMFVFFCCIAGLVGLATISRDHPDGIENEKYANGEVNILPREQTDEWKGWMQIVVLLYHFFGMSQVMWTYKLARVMVAAYLFLTGYGHTQYFLNTNDFSAQRFLAVLVRINLFSCMLAFAMNTTWHFYYFPALSSFWFVVTWATLPRRKTRVHELVRTLSRMAISAAIVQLILSASRVQAIIFNVLRDHHLPTIDPHEFYFRTRLDRFVPYLGILTAVLQKHIQQGTFSHAEWLPRQSLLRPIFVALGCVGLIGYFIVSSYCQDKVTFNTLHPYISIIPIAAYIVLRNATQSLSERHSRFFAWFGRHSLETYILQYHIWLAADAKGILRLGILDAGHWYGSTTIGSWAFWVETAIITMVFLWLSSLVSDATIVIAKWFVNYGREESCTKCAPMIPLPLSLRQPRWSWQRVSGYVTDKMGVQWKVFVALVTMWMLNRFR